MSRLGASLGAPKAPLSSNLVPLSLQVGVNLPLLAPTCALTSQLSINFGPKLPSKLKFSKISDPLNLDFCNTLQHFSRFFNISANRFEDAFQAPNQVQNGSQILPKCSQETPKRLPRHPQDPPKRPQERPERLQDPIKSPQDRQNIKPRASKSSRKSPKKLQEAPKESQDPPKSLPRPPKELPEGSQNASSRSSSKYSQLIRHHASS